MTRHMSYFAFHIMGPVTEFVRAAMEESLGKHENLLLGNILSQGKTDFCNASFKKYD